MSKKKHKHKQKNPVFQHGPQAGSMTQPAAGTGEELSGRVEAVYSEAMKRASDEDIQAVSEAPSLPGTDVEPTIRRAQEALELAERQRRTAEEGAKRIEKERAALALREDDLKERASKLVEKEKEAEAARAKMAADKERLFLQEEGLKKRELNAEAGFVKERRESLRLLEEEARAVREEIAGARNRIADERTTWETEVLEARVNLMKELSQMRHEHEKVLRAEFEEERKRLQDKSDELANFERRLDTMKLDSEKKGRLLEFERYDLEELRQNLEQRVNQLVAAREESLRFDIDSLKKRLDEACKERDRLDKMLMEREEADRRFGHRSPGQVLEELKAVTRERDELQKEIASLPSVRAIERLERMERDRESWENERYALSQENLQLKQRMSRCMIAVTELEALRDQKKALEGSRDLLQAALEDLRRDVDERIRRADGMSPFPSCAEMDSDKDLQATPSLCGEDINLAAFAEDLRHRIASDPQSPLYYSLRDLRCFLGGLAMSRLHLLQGISGTGKTSLPIAFSRAIGAGCTLIEVQAGWRDRQDLIGHFNAFERRFYESEFLQALYKAQCPKFSGRPYIVVLDEMNLSHPEQYFADLLSALEQPEPGMQKLDLMTAAVDPAPYLLKGGRTLAIPPNVWFVGTANHDETTKDFAPKTYDRAHVMELPRQRETFTPEKRPARKPIELSAIEKAFENARKKHKKYAVGAYQFIDEKLGAFLGKHFGIGWGNRLERQMTDFVPVVIAAGGTVGEATDHIIATKLLRGIRDRHDTRPEDLTDLRKAIESAWPDLDQKGRPDRSLAIVAHELRRLGAEEK